MHGDPGGLVEHQQLRVLVHDRLPDARQQLLRGPGGLGRSPRRCQAHRGDANLIARVQARFGPRALAVHAHLALADHAVDAAARQVAQALLHVVIEALPGLLGAHLAVLDGGANFGDFRLGQGILGVRHCFYNGLWSILRGSSATRTRQWWWPTVAARFSWTSESRPSHWAAKIAPAASNLATFETSADGGVGRVHRRFPIRTARKVAVINVTDEIRSHSPGLWNLRCRGRFVPWPPAVCLPAPHRTVGAHEENVSECNSGRGVARRSG